MPSLTYTFQEQEPVQFTPWVERTFLVVRPAVTVERVGVPAALQEQ